MSACGCFNSRRMERAPTNPTLPRCNRWRIAPHEGDHMWWVGVWRVVWRGVQTIKGGEAFCRKPLLPFIKPGARAGNELEDVSDPETFVKELARLAAQRNFVRIYLVHNGLVKAVMKEIKTSIYRVRRRSVHDVVGLLLN